MSNSQNPHNPNDDFGIEKETPSEGLPESATKKKVSCVASLGPVEWTLICISCVSAVMCLIGLLLATLSNDEKLTTAGAIIVLTSICLSIFSLICYGIFILVTWAVKKYHVDKKDVTTLPEQNAGSSIESLIL